MNKISETVEQLVSIGEYDIKPRYRKELADVGKGFVEDTASGFGGFDNRIQRIYLGLESRPKRPIDKLPNMTLFWNLQFNNRGYMYGSSLGHLHPNADFDTQEIYEFHGFGGMFISTDDQALFYVCKPNDKVPVPPNCFMTILNLSHQNLLTLDMANPLTNKSSKDIIKQKNGPMIAVYNTGSSELKEEVDFTDYKDRIPIGGKVQVRLNPNYPVFGITEPITIDIDSQPTLSGLYEAVLDSKKAFEKYNIEVLSGSPCWGIRGRESRCFGMNRGLIELVLNPEKPVHDLLGII